MTNKKDLKKTIKYICSDLFAECVAASLYSTNKSKENAEALLSAIIVTHNDFIKRISHPEPGMKPKVYFKTLTNDFNKRIAELIDQIANI